MLYSPAVVDDQDLKVSPNPLTLKAQLDAHEPAWTDWEYPAIFQALEELGYSAFDEGVQNMAQAISVAISQPGMTRRRPENFENIALALNGLVPDFSIYQPPSPAETAWAVYVLKELGIDCLPDQYHTTPVGTGEFSHSDYYPVYAYIEGVLHNNGISVGVESLKNVYDRTSPGPHRQMVLSRYVEYMTSQATPQAVELAEVPIDIEVAKLSAIAVYIQLNKGAGSP